MIAGALEVQMFANLARLTKDMAEAKSTVERSMKGIEGAVASAKAALGALGIGLGVGYFVSLIKGSIDAADHLNDLTKSTNQTVEQLAGLKLLAKQTGGDLDGMAASITKLSVNMGKEPEKFKALGLSAKDPIENFKRLGDIFVALQDTEQRNAVMATALGKAWASAAPALAEGGQRIGEIIEKGARLSGITKDMAVNADDFNDSMAELNTILGATKTKLVSDMLPGMNDIANAMKEAAKEGGLLLTIWVGLGGAMAHLLGITEGQKVKARLGEINEQLELARKQLQAGTLNPAGASNSFFNFLIPDVKLRDTAVAELRKTIAALEAEKNRLTPPAPAKPAGVDPAAAAAAAAKAHEFLKGEKEAKLAAAELLKYENALKSLEDQLGKFNNQTVEEKMVNDLARGSLKGLTEAHQAHLIEVAREIDAKKTQAAVSDSMIKAIEAQIAAQDKLTASSSSFVVANSKVIQGLEFEATLAGKNALEKEKANALEKIRLDYLEQAAVIGADESLTIAQHIQKVDELNAATERQRVAVVAGLEVRAAATTLDQKAIEQIQFETTLIGMNTTQREQAIAVRALELTGIDKNTDAFKAYADALKGAIAERQFAEDSKAVLVGMWTDVDRVAHDTFTSIFDSGKSAFDRLRDTLKNGLYSLLYKMAVQPFLIQIVASTAGPAVAQQVFGAAASTGGGIGGIGNILGLGNSAANLAGGSGSGLFGSFATSSFGQSLGLSSVVPDAAAAVGLGALEGATGSTVALSGAGSALGAAIPYVGLAIAAASMLGLFGSKKKPAVGTGYNFSGDYSALTGTNLALTGLTTGGNDVMPTGNHTALLNKQIGDAIAEIERSAKAMGLDASLLKTAKASFNFSTPGIGQAQDDLGVATVVKQVTDQLAALVPGLKDQAQANESLSDTLARLTAETKAANDEAVATAQNVLREAYTRQAAELEETVSKWGDAAKKLREYGESLLGIGAGGLSYGVAASRFFIMAAQARAGDVTAMGGLPGAGEAFRTASLAGSRTSVDYARDLAAISRAVTQAAAVADEQGSIAQRELNALTAQVSALITINESVVSVKDAIASLATAMDVSAKFTAAQEKAATDTAAAAIAQAAISSAQGTTAALGGFGASGQYTFEEYDRLFGGSHAGGGIASGWSLVGEHGPEFANFSDPARIYTADQTRGMFGGGNAEMLAELRALRAEVAALRKPAESTAASSRKTADTTEAVARGDLSFKTVPA